MWCMDYFIFITLYRNACILCSVDHAVQAPLFVTTSLALLSLLNGTLGIITVFFVFFLFGFNGPSRLFHLFYSHFESSQSIGGAKTGDPREKPPDHPQAELGLSHM